MIFRPFRIGYEARGGATLVKMFGRGDDGKRHRIEVTGTEPYFYAPAGYVESARDVKRIDRNAGQCWKTEVDLDRIVTHFPFEVPKVRDSLSCQTWEADIVYEKRIRYDYHIPSGIEVPDGVSSITAAQLKPCKAGHIMPRWVSLDIETYDRGGFHGAEDARAPVVSVALWDSFSERYVVIFNGELRDDDRRKAAGMFLRSCLTCGELDCVKHGTTGWKVDIVQVATEEALFSTLASWFRQVGPDIVVGWNVNDFDQKYLTARATREGMEQIPWSEYCVFDAMRGYEFSTYDSIESTGLHYIAVHHFGLAGKTTDKRIWQMMEHGRDELLYYNASDTFLVAQIVKRHKLLDFYLRLAERAGCGLDDTFSTGSLVDSMVFHHLSGTGRYQPTNVKREGEDEKIKGAEVFDPSDGLWFNAFASDNKSEYPMIMRTFNISPETIISEEQAAVLPHHRLASGNCYRTDRRGIYPELVEIIDKDRDIARATGDKVGDGVNKKLANTFFGFAPSKYNRNGNKLVGADITGMAREHLNWNKQFTESWRHPAKTLYGDTDSCYAVFLDAPPRAVVKERAEALVKELNASFPAFAAKFGQHDPSKVVLKVNLEQVYDAFLQAGTKKKYAALYETPKGTIERDGKKYEIKVRGFEARKSDAAQETKDIQQSTLELMLFGATQGEVVKHVSTRVKAWRAGEPEAWRLGIPQVVSKKQQILRAAEFSNSFLGTSFRKGDRPALFFGSVDGHPKTDVFLWEWRKPLPEGATLDLEHTIDRVLLTPLENVLDLLNIRPSDCSNPVDNADEWA